MLLPTQAIFTGFFSCDFGRIPVEERQLIDFIFVNGQVVANKFRVIADKPDNGYLSDHAPILANLTIR